MTLAELVARLGLAEVARRVGVSPATLRRWIARGPSAAGAARIQTVLRRHEGARRAAESRKRTSTFRDTIPTPPESELPANVVKPPAPPTSRSIEPEETTPYNTDRYTGEIHVVTVGQPVSEVDFDALGSFAARTWLHSRRAYVRARFLMFRYVTPGSPGKGGMVSRRGKWSEFWISTFVHSSESAIRNEISSLIDEGSEVGRETLRELSGRRIIWLEQMHLHTFDDNETPPNLATIVSRELHDKT